MPVSKLQDLVDIACGRGKNKMIVAAAHDPDLMMALKHAIKAGFITAVLIGDQSAIKTMADEVEFELSDIEIIHEPDPVKSCLLAVKLIKQGDAEIIMKGNVRTSILLKCILDKENGMIQDKLLSHIAFFETPFYHKILGITDAALNISPDINDKIEIINNAVSTCRKLGITNPRIAILAAIEIVNNKMEATVHAAKLKSMNQQYLIKDCIIDGPLALDNAISAAAAKHKGIVSEVAGNADVLVVPDINSGNILYKSLSFLGGAAASAVVVGASAPIVLTSRSDSDKIKFFSIALAAALL